MNNYQSTKHTCRSEPPLFPLRQILSATVSWLWKRHRLVFLIFVIASYLAFFNYLHEQPKVVFLGGFSVPKKIIEAGITEKTIRNHLRHALIKIHTEADSSAPIATHIYADKIDGSAPEELSQSITKISFGIVSSEFSIASLIAAVFFLPRHTLEGRVLCASPDCKIEEARLTLTIRVGKAEHFDAMTFPPGKYNKYFDEVAVQVWERLRPIVAAVYLSRSKDNAQKQRGLRLVQKIVRSGGLDKAWALNLLGVYHEENKNLDLALQSYKRAIRENRNLWLANFNIARLFIQQKKLDASISLLIRVTQETPNSAIPYYLLAGLMLEHISRCRSKCKFRLEDVHFHLRRGKEIDPNNYHGRLVAASVLFEEGKHAESLSELDHAISIDQRRIPAYLDKSRALRRMHPGNNNLHVKPLLKLYDLDKNSARAVTAIATELRSLGYYSKMEDVLTEYLSNNPSDKDVRFHMTFLQYWVHFYSEKSWECSSEKRRLENIIRNSSLLLTSGFGSRRGSDGGRVEFIKRVSESYWRGLKC